MTAYRSGTGRPVIASVTSHALPFFLTTIALSPTTIPNATAVPYNAPQLLDLYLDQSLYGGPASNRVVYVVNSGSGALPRGWSVDESTQSFDETTATLPNTLNRLFNPDEGFHILRCRGDGSQVEVVVREVADWAAALYIVYIVCPIYVCSILHMKNHCIAHDELHEFYDTRMIAV